jgi:CheY-like chemotaxis protein
MAGQILWLDNDVYDIKPYVDALRDEGYQVTVVSTVGDADMLIGRERYDLLILDVMVPTKNEEEEAHYLPEETEQGLKTGLILYRRLKRKLEGAKVLVLTVRLDKAIEEEFFAAGLPRECFETKYTLREAGVFLDKVKSLLTTTPKSDNPGGAGARSGTWRLFVSSTWADLHDERQALERALHQIRETEFNGMEYFGSREEKPKAVCLKEVRRSDIYVGVFGGNYGSIDPESGKSMTELEYREAKSIRLPCLIYLKDPSVMSPSEDMDAEGSLKLAALKQEIMHDQVVSFYKNADQLATKVVIDVHNFITEKRLPESALRLTPTALRLILILHFDLEELRTLCFDLRVDFDGLRGEGKLAKARELIQYLQRRGQLDRLIAELKTSRPNIAWG